MALNHVKVLGSEQLHSALTEAYGDRYEIVAKLGAGAHGVVYRAVDTTLDREVAVKQVRLDHFEDPTHADEMRRRTAREAKMAAKLRHPGIVAIHDVVHTATSTLLIMEFVNGETLEDELRERGRLSLQRTLALMEQVADALDHAHAHGVVHRDIKPANLILETNGAIKIADFGIAKLQAGSESSPNITATGSVLGTPYYMSPEQARGETRLDGRSDLFSLACVTYECLSGQKPFRAKTAVDVLIKIVTGEPGALDHNALSLTPALDIVLGKALEKKAAERYPTGAAFVEALTSMPSAATVGSDPVVTDRADGSHSSFDIELQGTLSHTHLAELTRLILAQRKTGILHIQKDDVSKRLYFRDGAIVFANSDIESDRLGQFLIRGGVIDAATYEHAAITMKQTRRRLATTLVALGSLDAEKVDALVNEQIQQIIYSIFAWETGQYGFETIDNPVEDDIALKLSTDAILLEGVRNMASDTAIRKAIGNMDSILFPVETSLLDDGKVRLTSSEGFVLSRVDGLTSVADLAAISPLGEESTLRCAYGLISAGILRVEEPKAKTTTRSKRVEAAAESASQPEPTDKAASKDESKAIREDVAQRLTSLDGATHYEALEVSRGATPSAIKKSYYTLAKKYHPDHHLRRGLGDLQSDFEQILSQLADAYEVLSSPPKQLRYDHALAREQQREAAKDLGAKRDPAQMVQTPPAVIAEKKYRAGMSYYDVADYHRAVENLREAVRLAPKNIHYHKLLGQALAKNPKWRKHAEGHFHLVLKAVPYDTECYLELAYIYEEKGLPMRAKKMYEQVLELDPDHPIATGKLLPSDTPVATSILQRIIGRDITP